jgi:large subunit ribosomal protein L29
MKYSEISSLAIEELKEKIKTEQENLRKLKFAHTISPIENPTKIKNTRRLIARLKTASNVKGS